MSSRKILLAAFAAGLVLMNCGGSGTPTGQRPEGSPAVTEQNALLVNDQPASTPQENSAVVVSQQPVVLDSSTETQSGELCLSQMQGLYDMLLREAIAQNGAAVEETCTRIRVRDARGHTTLDVRLHGQCSVQMTSDLGGGPADTTIEICP